MLHKYICGDSRSVKDWGKEFNVIVTNKKGDTTQVRTEPVEEEPMPMPTMNFGKEVQPVDNDDTPLVMPKMDFSKPVDNTGKKNRPQLNEDEEAPLVMPKCF